MSTPMRTLLLLNLLFFIAGCQQYNAGQKEYLSKEQVQEPPQPGTWRASVDSILPLFGHRNWILVVDKAFPALTASAGIQVVNTNEDIPTVLSYLHAAVQKSTHVKPHIFMDKELGYIPAGKGSQLDLFKEKIKAILTGDTISTILHDSVFTQMTANAKNFQVLVLKTNTCIAYSSVFFQLDCKYWDSDKEKALRAALNASKL